MTAHDLELPSNGDIDINPSFRPVAPEQVEGIDVGPGKEQASEADGVPHDDPTAEWGSGGRDFSRVADLGRFDRLYDLIDSHIMYPGVLARHGIQGTVNARLIVTPQGRCDWRHTQISSTQAHLRLYILDALMSVCRQDLVRYARKNENSNFDLSFQFSITEHNEKQLIDQQRKVVGNVFLFYRNSQQSALEWHLGPFRGMFPIPYVALDFAWLQENYDKVVNSRDPLRDFKDHLNQDEPSSEN